ncbi:site-specific tyrosine recombinase XerD [Propioniferax innocua]|uniref:Tyrosine recombinase XerC n=1 Tax=Propioniferax innocua TaxID=1753 RepID=A0A542ZB43_9ACTN|nr:site-specific tyrosine recombinase XerD [Propioniferax innocua]TQL57536.1 tyrosine recombinase XerD subunit [Propioniferax innocua]
MTSLEAVITAYLDHLLIDRGLSTNSIDAYRRDLARYQRVLADASITQIEEVTEADVLAFVGSLTDSGLARTSIARAVVSVRNLHTFAVAEGHGRENPAAEVRPPKPPGRLPKALTIAQVQALLDAPDRTTPEGLRDATLLELLYGTGARISEIVALDVDDLTRVLADPEMGLRLLGKGDKERLVPLGSFARDAVDAWLVRGRPVFVERGAKSSPALVLNQRGGRLSRQSAWAVLQRAVAAAGLDAEVSPHTLRHSYATHLLDGGADVRVVQELLGHASVATTQIYTLVTVDHLRETYLTSHPRAY